MQGFKDMWEDWYGDLLSTYEWHELEYKGREILYVHGVSPYTGDDGDFSAAFVQVMWHLDPEAPKLERRPLRNPRHPRCMG